jgi:hypothetical protein
MIYVHGVQHCAAPCAPCMHLGGSPQVRRLRPVGGGLGRPGPCLTPSPLPFRAGHPQAWFHPYGVFHGVHGVHGEDEMPELCMHGDSGCFMVIDNHVNIVNLTIHIRGVSISTILGPLGPSLLSIPSSSPS